MKKVVLVCVLFSFSCSEKIVIPTSMEVVNKNKYEDKTFSESVYSYFGDPKSNRFGELCILQYPLTLTFIGKVDEDTLIARYETPKTVAYDTFAFKDFCVNNSTVLVNYTSVYKLQRDRVEHAKMYQDEQRALEERRAKVLRLVP